jgi:Arc/MetJ-type ribon-helix-helix transcriptional regulator
MKSIPVNVKKRGRPATGQDPVSAVRLPTKLTAEVDGWARKHDAPSRSEAIRRLVQMALKIERPKTRPSERLRAVRAAELAARTIDKMIDPGAPLDERAQRRRRLTKGPSEFREDRVDLPKVKGK